LTGRDPWSGGLPRKEVTTLTFDAKYHGSLKEYHGRIACADGPDANGRYVLRLWDDPAGFTRHETLRGVRRQSFEPAFLTMGPGLVCSCGQDHDRSGGGLDRHLATCEKPIPTCRICSDNFELIPHI
jgi:hypothetical protein